MKQYFIIHKLHFLWHFKLCMLDVHIQTCILPFIPSFAKFIVFCKTTWIFFKLTSQMPTHIFKSLQTYWHALLKIYEQNMFLCKDWQCQLCTCDYKIELSNKNGQVASFILYVSHDLVQQIIQRQQIFHLCCHCSSCNIMKFKHTLCSWT